MSNIDFKIENGVGSITLNRPDKFKRWGVLWKIWHEWLNDNQITALEAAIRYVISMTEISKVLVGVDTKDQLNDHIEDLEDDGTIKSTSELKAISDPKEQLAERVKRSNAINDKINELNPEKDVAMEKNTELLRSQVSEKETSNFMENDANEVAEGENAASTLDNIKSGLQDVASRAKNAISNVFKKGDDTLNTSTNAVNGAVDDAKAVLKTEAKTMAEDEVVGSTLADTAAGIGSAALDAIPGADIVGFALGAGVAIKKAIQVRKLEKKDENVIADAPVVGSLQQIL